MRSSASYQGTKSTSAACRRVACGEVAARVVDAPGLRPDDRGGGEHERACGRVLEAVALELRARARDQLGRLVAVAALEGQDAELREAQRVQRRAP